MSSNSAPPPGITLDVLVATTLAAYPELRGDGATARYEQRYAVDRALRDWHAASESDKAHRLARLHDAIAALAGEVAT